MQRGKVAQQMVAQELIAQGGVRGYKPHFWIREKPDANAEVDLVHPYKNRLFPVEVKSGKTGSLKSLHQFIDRSDKTIAVRLHAGKHSIEESSTPAGKDYILINIPYYHTSKMDLYIETSN